ncbi:MAG: mechanosensitive ion channel [Verrucomicrobia bacterium]|nr:mechanosensitive ion channel [Verrucomicrobiota bacterium]
MTSGQIIDWMSSLLNYQLFTVNQTPITTASICLFAAVLAGFGLLSSILCRVILGRTLDRFHVEEGTRYNLLRITHYVVMLIGSLVAFQFIGIDLSGLAVVFGLLSVGIGFGLQNITSNFVAGLILLVERPIRVGDRVTIGGTEGDVLAINMRATTVRSLNNIDIIVPNSEFVSSQVINWSHGDRRVRLEIEVGVSYHSDLDTVMRCMREVAEENSSVLKAPAPDVMHLGFGDSAWNMSLRAWIAEPRRHPQVSSDLRCALVRKFRENGVEIPFPQRDLHVRTPLSVEHSGT